MKNEFQVKYHYCDPLGHSEDNALDAILAIQDHRRKFEPVHDIVWEEEELCYHMLDRLN
ncbi:hypothetical protein DFP90_101147 [Aestuariispira insulae]|uniref:Uncharacterized protein n=1 Tax=Aestuariispira insulae TaxID=1461337 RepID=A0A3D9HV96_9PROT|nr:hypothetical protein DFP90_101147 [Aestuariispira insulae]